MHTVYRHTHSKIRNKGSWFALLSPGGQIIFYWEQLLCSEYWKVCGKADIIEYLSEACKVAVMAYLQF